MTSELSSFSKFEDIEAHSVERGDKPTVEVEGLGDVEPSIKVLEN